MHRPNRGPSWRTVGAIIAGIGLIGWAVQDVLPWLQQAALAFGVVLVALGMVAGSRTGDDVGRDA